MCGYFSNTPLIVPAAHGLGSTRDAAPARRARTARELTGVLQSDLRRITGQAPNWRLERPGRAPLVLEITVPVEFWHGRDDANFQYPLAEAMAARVTRTTGSHPCGPGRTPGHRLR